MKTPSPALTLALALAVAACSPAPPPDDDGLPPTVATVAFDGLLLMQDIGPRDTTIHLFDPNTGATSTPQVLFNGPREAQRTTSPDGRHVAWFAEDGLLRIARPVLGPDGPELEVIHQASALGGAFTWGDDGALYTLLDRIDLTTGAVSSCTPSHPLVPVPLRYLPGSRDHFCTVDNDTLLRFRDGQPAGTVQGHGEPSPDGQFLRPSLHLPSGVQRTYERTETGPYQAFDPLTLPDGRLLHVPSGAHGEIVVEFFVGLETAHSREYVDTMPPDGRAQDPAAIYASGVVDHDGTRWNIEKALLPYFDVGAGRRYEPLFVRADGQSVVYSVRSHVVEVQKVGVGAGEDVNLAEIPVDSALVEVFADGTSRGFLTSATGKSAVVLGGYAPDDYTLRHRASRISLDRGDGDWLVPGWWRDSLGHLRPAVWGYRDALPVVLDGITNTRTDALPMFSPDGDWLLGVHDTEVIGAPWLVCLHSLAGADSGCITQPRGGTPIAVVGQGLASGLPTSAARPLILGVSRVAAPPGGELVVYGARLGDTGSLHVGDATVAPGDILAWNDHHVRFRVTAALPTVGRLRVVTAHGETGGRAFHVGRSGQVLTPFDGAETGSISLLQGLNFVDLGDLGLHDTFTGNPNASTLRIVPEARQPDGRFALFAGDEVGAHLVEVQSGPYSRVFELVVGDGLADPSRWQPVVPYALGDAHNLAFVTLAGDLIERTQGTHPMLASRFTLGQLPMRSPVRGATGRDIPEFFRYDDGHTFVSLGYQQTPLVYPGWPMRRLLGFTSPSGQWGAAQYADSPQVYLPNYHRHFAVDGDTLLTVGYDPNGESGAAYTFSRDGGATLEPTQLAPPELVPTTSAFMEPITVRAAAGTFFLVFEVALNAPEAVAVHAITHAGDVQPDVIALPPGASLSGYSRPSTDRVLEASEGGRVLLHFSGTHTMALVDFDDPVPAWTVVPAAADAGQVKSFTHDPATGDVLALRLDGTLARATRAGGWRDWAPLDLGVDLGVPIDVVPQAVGKLPNGRWVVLARWLEAGSAAAGPLGTPSFIGASGWLLGPQ